MYVHAGGKIEALGTGLWAAPRGGGAGEAVEASSATGMMTVETVCAVDVRDNAPPSGPLRDDVTASPRQSATLTGTGGGPTEVKKDKKTEERERKEADNTAKLAEREAKRQQVRRVCACVCVCASVCVCV